MYNHFPPFAVPTFSSNLEELSHGQGFRHLPDRITLPASFRLNGNGMAAITCVLLNSC